MSGLVGSVSSIPYPLHGDVAASTDAPQRGGDTEPTRSMSRELHAAFMAAYRAWASRADQLTIPGLSA